MLTCDSLDTMYKAAGHICAASYTSGHFTCHGLDDSTLAFVGDVLMIPTHSPLTQEIIRAPLAQGGLNIVHQATQSALQSNGSARTCTES